MFGAVGPWQLLIILVIILLVFGGRGRIPQLMKDMGTGINAFRKGLKDDDSKAKDDEAIEDASKSATAASSHEKTQDKVQ